MLGKMTARYSFKHPNLQVPQWNQALFDKVRLPLPNFSIHRTENMSSELWQRLRAARSHAGLRQQDIAEACDPPVTRGAVAQWESKSEENRTKPGIDHIKVYARLCGVPVEQLLDDSVTSFDRPAEPAPAPPSRSLVMEIPTPTRRAGDHQAPELDFFTGAVAYEVMQRDPALTAGFRRAIGSGPFAQVADFQAGDTVAVFAKSYEPRELEPLAGRLLMLEKALGHPVSKNLVVWMPGNHPDVAITQYLQATLGIDVTFVKKPSEAADLLVNRVSN